MARPALYYRAASTVTEGESENSIHQTVDRLLPLHRRLIQNIAIICQVLCLQKISSSITFTSSRDASVVGNKSPAMHSRKPV